MILGALALVFALWAWLEAARATGKVRELQGRFDELAEVNAELLEAIEAGILEDDVRVSGKTLPH